MYLVTTSSRPARKSRSALARSRGRRLRATPDGCGCPSPLADEGLVCDATDRSDPTGTGVTRRRFEADVVGRMRRLKSVIRRAVLQLDVLGLKMDGSVTSTLFAQAFGSAPGPRAFAHGSPGDKVHAFDEWLQRAMSEIVLGSPHLGVSRRQAQKTAWFSQYIEAAFRKGVKDAATRLSPRAKRRLLGDALWLDTRRSRASRAAAESDRVLSAVFGGPASQDRVDLLRTKTYTDLEGIDDATSQRISRVLAEGLQQSKAPNEIADDLTEAVENIGVTRARTMARTETIEAHAEGALNTYEMAGVEGVEVLAEFTTAGDDSVCPDCEELEGQQFSLEDARGVIPVHPNCRCAWVPVVGDSSDLEE